MKQIIIRLTDRTHADFRRYITACRKDLPTGKKQQSSAQQIIERAIVAMLESRKKK